MTDLRDAAKLALEVLEIAKEYIEAELYERRSMYEPYQMEYKYSNEYQDLETNKKAIAAIKRALAEDASQQRVDTSEEQRHEDWCASLNQMLAVMPPRPAPCDCKPKKSAEEPVAWLCERKGGSFKFVYTEEQLRELGYGNIAVPPFQKIAPLYTSPQQCPNCASLMEQNTELDKKLAELEKK